jgi:hypothetical protein
MGRRLRRGCREVGIEFWYRDWTSPISDAVRARSLTRLKYTEFRDDGVGVFGKKPDRTGHPQCFRVPRKIPQS